MLTLGFDTATAACTVGLVRDGAPLAECTVVNPRGHSALLMPLVDQILRVAGAARGDLGGIACGVGPGSFTGLRIGLSTARALAFGLGIPCAPVVTLAALAAGAAPAAGPGALPVCPLLDARRDEVYAALFGPDPEQPLLAPAQEPVERWLERLAGLGQAEGVLFLGDGAARHRERIQARLGARARFGGALQDYPRGAVVAALGAAALARGQGLAPDGLKPLYLRKSQAEVLWEQRRGGGA